MSPRVLFLILIAMTTMCPLSDEMFGDEQEAVGRLSNLCINPGFELLNPAGDNFPLNWHAFKSPADLASVIINKDAHGGSVAVRMTAAPAGVAGLNSVPISIRKGTVTFHYKAVESSSAGDNLRMFVIALANGANEITRTGFVVPKEHVGDGEWRLGTVDFDFSANAAVDAVLIAPRVNETVVGGKGEWIVDDFECIEKKVGPRPEIEAFFMPEPILQIGKAAELVVQIGNYGDAVVPASKVSLSLPPEVAVKAGYPKADLDLDALAPGRSQRLVWQMIGKRPGELDLDVRWSGEGFALHRSRHTVCVERLNPRDLCTRADGFWRLMPKPISLQSDNPSPLIPLKTMKSSELPDSYIGITAHLPRTKDFETIFEPEHLIDGDRQTSWSGRAYDVAVPGSIEWVQIDFTSPSEISEVRLIPYWKAEGFPADFKVMLRHGKTWKTIYEGRQVRLPTSAGEGEKEACSINVVPSREADSVRIEVTRFSPTSGFFTDCATTNYFRLSEVEAISASGENVALTSKGGRVKVSSTFRSYYNSTQVVRQTYKELYNLGVKWNRVGQWGDWTCWAAVEQKKGEYYIDPATDEAITASVKNGVNILLTLDYGNPLYEETPWLYNPGPVWRHSHPFTGDGGPTKPESIRGFVNYAKFMAQHFKGRVKHYEIWNEENSWAWYGSPPDPKAYGTLVRETAKALKEIDPEIYVVLGGTAALAPTFVSQALEEGGGKYIDAVAYHPYGAPMPEMAVGALDVVDGKQTGKSQKELGFTTTEEMLAYLRKTFRRFNPNLEFWANEWNVIPTREGSPYRGLSEIAEAKHAARFFMMGTLTGVRGVWWSLANENTVYEFGILRTGDLSRKPVYYTIQAITTLLSGARPDKTIKATIVGDAPELRCETLRGRDGKAMVAIWSAVASEDDYVGTRVSVKISGLDPKHVEAVDTLHALVQELNITREGDSIVIGGLLVMDYPIVIRVK